MNFDDAFVRLIGHEGGVSNNPADGGGLTKYGISKRAYPGEDIINLTLDRAKRIYHQDYWGPAGCDTVPEAIKFDLFDMAVNSGVKTAIKTLQKAVGQFEDGVLGPKTLQAIQSTLGPRLVARFNGSRLMFMTDLGVWPTFGKGWARRIASNLLES